MGKGLALIFKTHFHDEFLIYKRMCHNHEIKLGNVYFITGNNIQCKEIMAFPTKEHWRDKSNINDIEHALQKLSEQCIINGIKIQSLAIPKIGCGLGGLNWNDVKSLIIKYLGIDEIKIKIYIYE